MNTYDSESLKLIFGIKLKTIRQEKGYSLQTLSRVSGISPSYLNEIEKGKKYPRKEKIQNLARALELNEEELVSPHLKKELSFLTKILEKNIIKNLPFDIFGIPPQTLFEWMAEEPAKMSALLGTVLELSRQYDMKADDFFYATLRAYLDMHNNYFPEIEKKITHFKEIYQINTQEKLKNFLEIKCIKQFLEKHFKYSVIEKNFEEIDPEIKNIHYYFETTPRPTLFLNKNLGEPEKLFILIKEIAHQIYKHEKRFYTSDQKNINSFETVFNNFKASYFSSALLLPQDEFIQDIQKFFSHPHWEPEKFLALISKQKGTMQSFFHRLSQILPEFLGMEQIFFLIFKYDTLKKEAKMSRELHLSELHAPHSIKSSENYCQRWMTTSLLKKLSTTSSEPQIGIQRSRFFGTQNEYLNFSLAHEEELNPHIKVCVTIGILLTPDLNEKIKFISDPQIVQKEVSDTCEQCGIIDCEERIAQPVIYYEKKKNEIISQKLKSLISS